MTRKITSILLAAVLLFGMIASSAPAAFAADNYPLNSIVIKIEDAVTHAMLAGARFELYYNNQAVSGGLGTLVATIDTDSSGVIVISGLPSGYYIVRQTVPPNNYHLSINNEQHCYIKPDGTSIEELVFSNYRYGGLAVILTDKDTGRAVGGATFSVTDVSGKVVGTSADGVYTTDAKGEFYLENLPAGDYKITQLTAAQGYAMDSVPNMRTVRLQHTNADQSVFRATFENSPLGSLLVRVKDAVSKEPLPGAKFNVKISGGADLGEYTTGANGTFLLPKIARGTYIITQVSAPAGYLTASAKTQYVDYVNTYAVDFENSPKSGLHIVKVDADTKEPLKDAKFNVYKDAELIGAYTTNADGAVTIPNLEPGWYTVSEYAAPQGYVLDDTPQSVQVTSEKLHKLTFEDRKLASIQIIKTDEYNGEPLAGAKFRVTTQNGQFVADVTTDLSGKATIPGVAPGWYVISETKAPVGYLISESARTVEVKATVPTVVTVTNRAENNIQILKLDAYTRAPLSGATFKVEQADGKNVGTYNTDSAGKILVGNLREGAYVISEIKAPDGYQLDAEPQTITIEGGKTHSVEFLDKPLSGIWIVKTDVHTHAPLANATFTVERDNGEKIGTYKTDSVGKVIVSGLTAGTYIVSETIAPEGYILDAIPQTVVVKNSGLTVAEFTNKPFSGIQILKTGMDGKTPLIGAVFTIERVNGEKIGKYTTDAAGKIIVHGLAEGVYIVSEIQAPEGYLLGSLPQTVEVKSGKLTIAEFTNKELPNLYIRKTDADTGEMLSGAEFVVEKSGVFVAYVVSSEDGPVIVPRVQPGTYMITEVVPPDGYELNDPVKMVEVTATGDVFFNSATLAGNTVTFGNNKLNSLEIVKLDSITKNPLSGAMFTVDKANGERIGSYRTDSAGKILIPGLSAGTYVISETAAPNGYILSESPKSVNLSGGRLVGVEFLNKPLSGIQIVKMDAVTHQPLKGAAFTVTKADGTRIGTFRTEADGKVVIGDLGEGVYVVGEITAPDGYQLDETPKNVTVTSGKLATVEFTNKPYSGIQIVKTDAVSHQPLSGATFEVTRSNGEKIGIYKTDVSGKAVISDLAEGTYIVSETIAPDGYVLDNTPQTVTVKTGKLTTAEFVNKPFSGIEIRKVDAVNGDALSGAVFEVRRQNGEYVTEVTTDKGGKASIANVEPGWYTITETKAPQGYVIDGAAKTVEVKSTAPTVVTVSNKHLSGIQILKIDAVTKAPLMGAVFTIQRVNGERVGNKYTTDVAGKIIVSDLAEGVYIVSEIEAPAEYVLDAQPQTVEVKSGKLTIVEFTNKPFPYLNIVKKDAATGQLVAGAQFTVANANGTVIANVTSLASGAVSIKVAPGVYVITEVKAPDGYELNDPVQTVEVKADGSAVWGAGGAAVPGNTVTFGNNKLNSLEIVKLDSVTKNPLSGAMFTVDKANGERIGSYKTDSAGKILIPDLSEGTYVISETAAPDGYILNESPKSVNISGGKLVSVEFLNKPLSGIQIIKTDASTHAPLPGAAFTVERANGEKVGSYKTDTAGKIIVSGLAEGTYIVSETIAPDGYILDAQPQTVIVTSDKITTVEFSNKPLAGLQIIKIDSGTRQPIAGVTFSVSKMSGERVGEFSTDRAGTIFIPNLESGWYTVVETKAANGYIIESQPRNIEVTWGKSTTITVENTAMSGLLIVKTDAATGKPLVGVVFDVRRADGQFVAGSIADGNQPNTEANSPNKSAAPNGDITGSYTTDANGRIQINTLPAGEYHVIERKALDGYELDADVHSVTVTPGKLATLQLTNKAKAGFRLLKIDSVTKKGIFGVEFMVFDANNKVVGTYITDNNGVIDFDGILTEGRYTIRETRPANGYYTDDMPRTVEFRSGKITEVVWENTPQMGQIQITKLSGDDNEVNGLEKGAPLAGATFEIYQYKSGNLVDRFVSGADGRAVSKPLPLGRYIVKEVQAPQWYRLSTESMDIEIEFATQIIKREFLNFSANTGVKIRKVGNYEAMPGDTIRYDIKEIANTSSVQLTDFFWRDIIPTDAVRLNKIVTGTYNQSLKYKVIATTNKGDTRVIADNLSTTQNNVIDCRNAALGLANDEYVTSFTLVFGTVKAGFTKVTEPQVFVTVKTGMANGYEFANKADVGGKYGSEWVIGNSTWLTKCYAPPTKLPRTGY